MYLQSEKFLQEYSQIYCDTVILAFKLYFWNLRHLETKFYF